MPIADAYSNADATVNFYAIPYVDIDAYFNADAIVNSAAIYDANAYSNAYSYAYSNAIPMHV